MAERDTVAALSPSDQTATVDDTYDVFTAAAAQGIGLVAITSANLSELQGLNIPADAKARIATDVGDGFGVIIPDQTVMLGGTPTIAWAEINPATGEYIGVDSNGGHQGLVEYLDLVSEDFELAASVTEFFSPVAGFDAGAILSVSFELNSLTGDRASAKEALTEGATQATDLFKAGLNLFAGTANILKGKNAEEKDVGDFEKALKDTVLALTGEEIEGDPPLSGVLTDPLPLTNVGANVAAGSMAVANGPGPGAVAGAVRTASLTVSQEIAGAWSSAATSNFLAMSLNAAVATVIGAGGQAVGTGSVAFSSSSLTDAGITGNDQYAVNGTGSLSFYGPAESSLGVSGDWQNYTATVTGNVSITLTVPTSALTLNGQTLPAGTYTITTNSATLSGSGTTSSPNFAGSASITATGGTINVGPGSGSISVGGTPLDPEDETTLDGYSGTISVSANGDGTDSVNLNGNAGNALQVAVSPAAFTTDQNTPITFQPDIQTSFADTYNLTANAPRGWTVTIDDNGNVTATPAAGLQGGTYPIQIIAQSQTDPNLEAQTTVEVTITPTQPGVNFSVVSDPLFTVPYDGAAPHGLPSGDPEPRPDGRHIYYPGK